MTSATDRLRALLDERGVEYSGSDAVVYFEDVRGYKASAYDAPRKFSAVLCISHTATPEQAVEATLGRGTCHKVKREDATDMFDHWVYGCSECGAQLDGIYGRYCPNCGRRVEC